MHWRLAPAIAKMPAIQLARKTLAGKQRSSWNAMRHGFTGHMIVLLSEDLEAYRTFTNQFFDDLKPVGILEEQLVQSLADTSGRLNRIPALENNLLALGFYVHENRITTEHPEAHAALVIVEWFRENIRAFTALSMHGQRLSSQFERTLKQLRALQFERRNPPKTKDFAESGFVFSNPRVGQASLPVSDVPSALRQPIKTNGRLPT